MSKNFLDRILGFDYSADEDIEDYGTEDYFKRQKQKEERLKEKIFSDESLTYDEYIQLVNLMLDKFKDSFGCFNRDLEIVFREKKKTKKETTKNEK